LESSNSGSVQVAGRCEHGNEPPGCIKDGKFVYQLSDD